MELEYKFEVEDMIEAHRLGRASVWADWPERAPGDKFHCHADYFDTDDRQLDVARAVLRLRREGDATVMTLKYDVTDEPVSTATGRFERQERSLVLDAPTDQPPVERWLGDADFQTGVPLAIRRALAQPLAPRYTVDFARQIRFIGVGSSVVEVALDHGFAQNSRTQVPFLELELELKSGNAEDLDRLARWVTAQMRVTPQPLSKYARCRALDERMGT